MLEPNQVEEADTPTFGTPAVPDTLGELGPYRLLSILGEGTMAVVYAAEHSKLGRRCAIKRLRPEHLVDHEMVQRFLAEARTVAAIQHPNLVTIYDVVEEPGEAYLVMELLDGRDLETVLMTGALALDRALRIAVEICEALIPVHARGIVHRDIKPANVYLSITGGREQVKMLDFGAARLLSGPTNISAERRLKQSNATLGSPMYMSPEQCVGEDLDARSDLYSVGVVMYQMISGRLPFHGETFSDVMLQHVHAEPKPLGSVGPQISREIEAVVMRCLLKQPEARFASAQEMLRELARAGAPLGITPTVSLGGERVGATDSARGRTLMAMGLLLGLVVLATVMALSLRPRPGPGTGAGGLDTALLTDPTTPAGPAVAALAQPPLTPPAPATRIVQMLSTPSGAIAEPDGARDGCITPCMLTLPLGPIGVTFRKPGFRDTAITVPANDLKARAELKTLVADKRRGGGGGGGQKKSKQRNIPTSETLNPFDHK